MLVLNEQDEMERKTKLQREREREEDQQQQPRVQARRCNKFYRSNAAGGTHAVKRERERAGGSGKERPTVHKLFLYGCLQSTLF